MEARIGLLGDRPRHESPKDRITFWKFQTVGELTRHLDEVAGCMIHYHAAVCDTKPVEEEGIILETRNLLGTVRELSKVGGRRPLIIYVPTLDPCAHSMENLFFKEGASGIIYAGATQSWMKTEHSLVLPEEGRGSGMYQSLEEAIFSLLKPL